MEEKEKKARLDQELEELRYNLELEMQSASREQDAIKIREGNFSNLLLNFLEMKQTNFARQQIYSLT